MAAGAHLTAISVILLVAAGFSGVSSHGMLTKPISRALRDATGRFNGGMEFAGQCPGSACEWYTQWTVIPGNKTNCDPLMRTMGVDCSSDHASKGRVTDFPCSPGIAVPWCAPGTAPVKSPCGVFAGGYDAASRDMLDLDGTPIETWAAGSTQDVSFAVTANHGGGYSYRLCRADSDLSEDCFQRGHLNFAGVEQRVVDPAGKQIGTIPARRTSTGTTPPGSQWTRNPMPQERDIGPGVPGMPNVYGRGPFALNIVDQVMVPADAKPGHYVLSWRWDAEQTKQVWSHCSDVNVVAPAVEPKPGHPAAAAEMVEHLTQAVGIPHDSTRVCNGSSIGLDIADCNAWIDLYDALGGVDWPESWSEGCVSLRTDPCGCNEAWQKKIICEATRDYAHITEIYLLAPDVKGVFPHSIVGLSHLQALSMVGTGVTGTLPSNFGDMQALEMIWLDHNPLLGGVVPASLAQLPKLSVLELHRSNFSGVLPPLNYGKIPDCCLNDVAFDCPIPEGAETCGAACGASNIN